MDGLSVAGSSQWDAAGFDRLEVPEDQTEYYVLNRYAATEAQLAGVHASVYQYDSDISIHLTIFGDFLHLKLDGDHRHAVYITDEHHLKWRNCGSEFPSPTSP